MSSTRRLHLLKCFRVANGKVRFGNNNILLIINSVGVTESLRFWEMNINMRTSKLVNLAQDLVGAPASQAYVDRVFHCAAYLHQEVAAA